MLEFILLIIFVVFVILVWALFLKVDHDLSYPDAIRLCLVSISNSTPFRIISLPLRYLNIVFKRRLSFPIERKINEVERPILSDEMKMVLERGEIIDEKIELKNMKSAIAAKSFTHRVRLANASPFNSIESGETRPESATSLEVVQDKPTRYLPTSSTSVSGNSLGALVVEAAEGYRTQRLTSTAKKEIARYLNITQSRANAVRRRLWEVGVLYARNEERNQFEFRPEDADYTNLPTGE